MTMSDSNLVLIDVMLPQFEWLSQEYFSLLAQKAEARSQLLVQAKRLALLARLLALADKNVTLPESALLLIPRKDRQ